MEELSNPILLVSLKTPEERSRSISPNSTTSSAKDIRGIKLFRAIGKRLSRHRHNDGYESTDSEPSSSSDGAEGQSDSGSGNNSPDCSSKESKYCDSALRKVFNSLNLSTSSDRRSSDSNSDISSSSSKKKSSSSTPKKILRQPVSYTYVRGLSGLPTIRVPRTNSCCAQSCCRCHTPGCGR